MELSTIECEQALKQIHLFLDGELPQADIDELSSHLRDCPPCGDRAEFQRRLKVMIASKCCDDVPDSLRVRIDRIVRAGSPEPPDAS